MTVAARQSVYERLVEQFYASVLDNTVVPALVQALCVGFRANLVTLQADSTSQGHFPIAHYDDTGSRINGMMELLVTSGLGNPLMEGGKADKLAQLGTAHDEGLFPEGYFERTDFYQHVLKPFDVRHSLGLCLYSDDRGRVEALTINRSPQLGFFTHEEASLARRLLPHARNVHALQRHLRNLENFSAGLEQSETAAWLLDAQSAVAYANGQARTLTGDAQSAIRTRGRHLQAVWRSDVATLRQAMISATCAQPRQQAEVLLHGAQGQLWGVARLHPLHPATLNAWMLNQPAAAVLFLHPFVPCTSAPADTLRRVFSLTRAEAELACAFLQHGSLAACRDALGKSNETLRTQLKALFAKTGTHGQVELLCRLRATTT